MKSNQIIIILFIITFFPNLYCKKLETKTPPKENKTVLKSPEEQEREIYQWFRTISEVVHLVSKKHYKNVEFPDFVQEALKAAVPHTDAHSSFFPKESYKAALESTSGEFSGIGISIMSKAPEDDSLVIIDVIRGGPSDKGGLKNGDKIVEVDGEALKGLSSDEVVTALRGKVGTNVKLKIIRKKKPKEFIITREIIKDQSSICYNFDQQNVSYLSLKIFSETAAKQMAELLKKAKEQKRKGIILDLRRNPGGILDSAVDMASLFLKKGSLVVCTKDKNKNVITSYPTKTNPVLNSDLPIFILIDNFTASASEILAGCLKHYSEQDNNQSDIENKNLMVFLVGTETFGKGSVQEVIPISNGCALKLTTMLYYLPNDASIQAKGIQPDFVIKPKTIPEDEIKWINELYGKETSLKHHITVGEVEGKIEKIKQEKKVNKQEKKEEEISWEERHKKAIGQDVQIQACVNMINMLNIAKQSNPKSVDNRQKALAFLKQNYLTDEPVELRQIK